MPKSDLVLAPETKPRKKIQFDLHFSEFYLKKFIKPWKTSRPDTSQWKFFHEKYFFFSERVWKMFKKKSQNPFSFRKKAPRLQNIWALPFL